MTPFRGRAVAVLMGASLAASQVLFAGRVEAPVFPEPPAPEPTSLVIQSPAESAAPSAVAPVGDADSDAPPDPEIEAHSRPVAAPPSLSPAAPPTVLIPPTTTAQLTAIATPPALAAVPAPAPAPAFPTPQPPCDPTRAAPSLPVPGAAPNPRGFSSFREPLPPAPLWNPAGPKRVGLQAGHWLNEETPPELGRLQHGATGGGKMEWEVNLEIANRVKAMLEAAGVEVDLLPTTVPPRYRAHAFVSIHADGDTAGALRGYKIARPGFSSIPDIDDEFVSDLYAAYGPATGLRRDDEHISVRMRYYYVFNSRRYCHTVAPGVPQAIVEAGFLTSAADRAILIGTPNVPARGIADGILRFLDRRL